MTPSFNVIDEPWLPCLFQGEPTVREVSLREALARAPDIVELTDPSPLVTVALHRLLLAVLHRVFGPSDIDEWEALWRAGHFDGAALDAYLDQWRHRFDLFDAERPFYQTPGLPDELALPAAALSHEFALTDDKPVLFDHLTHSDPPALTPAQAARALIAHQSFARSGTITPVPPATRYAKAGPLYKGAVVLARGRSLFESLTLNLIRVDGRQGLPWEFDPTEDVPAWESKRPAEPEERDPHGYLDYLTWQTRRVVLLPHVVGSDVRVTRCVIGVGEHLSPINTINQREQMVAFRKNRRAKAHEDAFTAVTFQADQALWRDSTALLANSSESARPGVLDELASRTHELGSDTVYALSAFGLRYNPKRVASVILWRREDLPLPLAYLTTEDLVTEFGNGIRAAEATGRELRASIWTLSAETLSPDGNADRARVAALVDSLAAERTYWPQLDVPFRRFMRDLAAQYDADEGVAAKAAWLDAIRTAAWDAFGQAARAVETSGRGYRAAAAGRRRFAGGLVRAIRELRPEPEQTPEEANT